MKTPTYAPIPADAAIARMWLSAMCTGSAVSFAANVHGSSVRTFATKRTARPLGSSST